MCNYLMFQVMFQVTAKILLRTFWELMSSAWQPFTGQLSQQLWKDCFNFPLTLMQQGLKTRQYGKDKLPHTSS